MTDMPTAVVAVWLPAASSEAGDLFRVEVAAHRHILATRPHINTARANHA